MAKSFSVSFDILGKLDGSLVAALTSAAQKMKSLGEAAKSLNGKSLKLAQTLQNSQGLLKNVEAYNKLNAAIKANFAEQAKLRLGQSKLLQQRAAEQKKLGDMRSAYQQLQQVYKANRKSMGSDAAAVMKSQLKDARAEIKAQERHVTGLGTAFDTASKRVDTLRGQLSQQQGQLSQMRSTIPSSNIAAAEAALRSQINQTTEALNREIAALQRRNEIQQNFSQSGQDLANSYGNFQNALDTAGQMMSPFKNAADNAIEFEYAMSKVKSLTQMRDIRAGNLDKVNASMTELTALAENLGATTEFTSTKVANAMGKLGMAGWDDVKIKSAMPAIVDAASIVGDGDIDRTADVISDDMTALGIKAGESYKLAGGKIVDGVNYYTDAFAYGVTQANLNREQLHEALKYNAAPMKQAGFTLGEIFGANMLVANSGIKGSQAGTAFRAGAIRLQAPAKAGAKALEEMGMSASDAQKEMAAAGAAMDALGIDQNSSMMQKVAAIKQKFDENLAAGNSDANAQMLNDVFGKNAFTAWAQVMEGSSLEEIMKIADEIDNGKIEGWAHDTAEVMRDNTHTSIELLNSSIDALERSFGQALTPTIREAAETLAPLVDKVREFVQENPQLVQAAAAIAATLATATVAMAGFSLAMAGVRFAQAGWQTAGLLFGDIAKSAATATSSVARFFASMSAGSAASGVSATLSSIGTSLANVARAAMGFAFSPIGAALLALGLAGLYVYQNWDKVSSVFSDLGNALSGIVMPAINSAVESFGKLAETLGMSFDSSAFQSIGDVVSSLASAVGGGLVGAFLTLAGVVGSVLAGIVTGISGLVTTISELGTGLTQAFYQISEGNFSDAFSTLADSGKNAAENFKNAWSDAFSATKDGFLATNRAVDNFVHYDSQAKVTGGGVGAMQAQVAEATPLDTSATQSALDQVGNSAQNAATNMDGVNQAIQQISQTGLDLQTFSTNSQLAGTEIQNLGLNSQQSGTEIVNFGTSAQTATGGVDALATSSDGATGSVDAMATSAGSVADALAAKASEISSISISIPQVSVAPAAVASNFSGGIYPKGQFLTTFAEKSPEAAIPIDNSQRARDLWTRTGQMLGMIPGDGGNPDDKVKKIDLARQSERIRRQWQTDVIGGQKSPLPVKSAPKLPETPQKLLETQPKILETSPLGDLQGIEIPEYNRINEDDSVAVKRAKLQAQRELLNQKLPKPPEIQPKLPETRRKLPEIPQKPPEPSKPGKSFGTDIFGGMMSKIPSIDELFGQVTTKIPSPASIFNQIPSPSGLFGDIFNQIPSGGLIGDLIGNLFPTPKSSQSQPVSVTVNVTVNGNADENSVKNGVESAIPALEDWAQQFAAHQHELERASFA